MSFFGLLQAHPALSGAPCGEPAMVEGVVRGNGERHQVVALVRCARARPMRPSRMRHVSPLSLMRMLPAHGAAVKEAVEEDLLERGVHNLLDGVLGQR